MTGGKASKCEKRKMNFFVFVLCMLSQIADPLQAANVNSKKDIEQKGHYRVLKYMVYIATWEDNVFDLVEKMIEKQTIFPNTILYLAFANYNWGVHLSDKIPGIEHLTAVEIQAIVDKVHQAGGKIGLSIGGTSPKYNYHESVMYGQPALTAACINGIVNRYGFDAIDFDVEAAPSSVPIDFANHQAEVILSLRRLNPGLYINLTLDSQGWASGDYQQPLLVLTKDAIHSFAPLEWDLWVDAKRSYVQQIQWNINYYMKAWGIPAGKITLGLMPGLDNMQRNLSLSDAVDLARWAVDLRLQGISIWDADNDSRGVDGCLPFAYTLAVEDFLMHPEAR